MPYSFCKLPAFTGGLSFLPGINALCIPVAGEVAGKLNVTISLRITWKMRAALNLVYDPPCS
jgi:hypothetical protein